MKNFEVDEVINDQYYKSGLAGFLKRNSPELFIILIRQVIPKHRQILEIKGDIFLNNQQLQELEERLTQAEINLKNYAAQLRFWEREEKVSIGFNRFRLPKLDYYLLLNLIFDWTLKTGLTVVPILSLLGIAGIKLSSLFDSDKRSLMQYILFSSISLVWLTSATISSWIISHPNSDHPKNYQILKGRIWNQEINLYISHNTLTIFILFGIWMAEALIGFALIPGLIDSQRASMSVELGANQLKALTDMEKFEILFGVGIFAFINILFSVTKGRMYRFSTPRKQQYGMAVAEKIRLSELVRKKEFYIENLKNQVASLEEEVINPRHFQGTDYFNKAINDISTFSMQGRDIEPIFESFDFYSRLNNNDSTSENGEREQDFT